MRNRYYDPSSGRFTQEDPIGLAGGLNAYGFANGDPVNYDDPFGLCIEDACLAEGAIALYAVEEAPVALHALSAALVPLVHDAATVVAVGKQLVAVGEQVAGTLTQAYKRPSYSVTSAQRASVQGGACVTCGATGRMVADHKTPLVKEYYETGGIDKAKMRSISAVQPQCPHCSAQQGAAMSQYSKGKKTELALP